MYDAATTPNDQATTTISLYADNLSRISSSIPSLPRRYSHRSITSYPGFASVRNGSGDIPHPRNTMMSRLPAEGAVRREEAETRAEWIVVAVIRVSED